MSFLGEGSEKSFEYSPIKSITLYSEDKNFFIQSANKKYSVGFPEPLLVLKQDFNSKFALTLKKNKNNVLVFVGERP
jgi:hypothetical protein